MNTSLTSPADRTGSRPIIQPQAPPLTDAEFEEAKVRLNCRGNFPAIERRFCDPELPFQKVGLVSFIPAKGARPDADGFYGFLKLRGNYQSPEDANDRAEFLIRESDSYHEILHTRVGMPFPLLSSKEDILKHSADDEVIDLTQKKITREVREDIQEKRKEEKSQMKNIQAREQELLKTNAQMMSNDSLPETDDPDEAYTLLRSKRAQLIHTYLITMKRVHKEIVPALVNCSREVSKIDNENPDLKEECYRRFKLARDEVGIPEKDIQSGFVHYIIDDVNMDEFKSAFFGDEQRSYQLLQEAIVQKQ